MKFFFASLLINLISVSHCFGEDDLNYIEHWQHIIKENKSPTRSEKERWELDQRIKTFNEFEGKLILSFIRGGDYTHVGEEKAIDLMMADFVKDPSRKILDVACGLGGTADYIQGKGWGQVTGFDIEESSIKYALETYPQGSFFKADVASVAEPLKGETFDLICIVNSLVCFPDQLQALKELREIANPKTQLVILDYTDLVENGANPLVGYGREISFLPIRPLEFNSLANSAGWNIIKYEDLGFLFEEWYKDFLDLTESKRLEIDARFGKNATHYVRGKYDLLYYALKKKWIGGALVILTPNYGCDL